MSHPLAGGDHTLSFDLFISSTFYFFTFLSFYFFTFLLLYFYLLILLNYVPIFAYKAYF